MKICSRCKIIKNLNKFYKDKKSKDGRTIYCAECNKELALNDYRSNIEKRRLKNKIWSANNAEQRKAYKRKLYASNPNYRQKDLDRHRKYREDNKDEIKKKKAAYYMKNRERERAKARTRYQNNPDYFKENARKRKNRLKSTIQEPYTKQQIYDRDKGLCFKCNNLVNLSLKHPDPMCFSFQHALPLILGGHDTPANVLTSHLVCNLQQGIKPFNLS